MKPLLSSWLVGAFVLLAVAAPLEAQAQKKGAKPPGGPQPSRDWTAGATKEFPCPGAPELKLDVWIPLDYPKAVDRSFPVLYLVTPNGKRAGWDPGFMDLEKWADREGVIIVALNDSKDGPEPGIHHALKVGVETVDKEFRASQALRFVMGSVGATWQETFLANHLGDRLGGILFLGFYGFFGPPIPGHVAIASLHGDNEQPYGGLSSIETAIAQVRKDGRPYFEIVRPGANLHGSIKDWEPMAQFVLDAARAVHPLRSRAEIQDFEDRLKKRIEILEKSTAVDRFREIDLLLRLPGFETQPERRPLLGAWFKAGLELQESQTEPLARYDVLKQLLESPRTALVPGCAKEKQALKTALQSLRKESPVKEEVAAETALAGCIGLEKDAGGLKARLLRAAEAYELVARKHAPTKAGIKAKEAAERLRKSLR